MLTDFFDSAARIQALRDGPARTLFEAFAQALGQGGYAEITARRHIRAAEHFIYWADRTGIPVRGPIEPALERFDRHLRRGGRCPHFGHTFRLQVLHGARLFLKHLQDARLIESPVIESTVFGPPLVVGFSQWMHQQRGTCESTLFNYGVHICELLKRLGEEPVTWDARSLRQFVLEGSRTCGWAAAKKRTTALRMFLRFLIAEGKCASGLDGAIPVLAHWRLSWLRDIYRRTTWNASLRRAIPRRQWANVIVRSSCFSHDWVFGPATSFSCGCMTLTGKGPGFTSAGRDVVKRDCR